MGNLGGGEVLVILFIALMVLGPNKLPEAARQVGRAVNEIRRVSGGFQREMREAMNEPIQAAHETRSQILDPFSQASSSASRGAAGVPKAGNTDSDPPLPSPEPRDGSDIDPAADPTKDQAEANDPSPSDNTDN